MYDSLWNSAKKCVPVTTKSDLLFSSFLCGISDLEMSILETFSNLHTMSRTVWEPRERECGRRSQLDIKLRTKRRAWRVNTGWDKTTWKWARERSQGKKRGRRWNKLSESNVSWFIVYIQHNPISATVSDSLHSAHSLSLCLTREREIVGKGESWPLLSSLFPLVSRIACPAWEHR